MPRPSERIKQLADNLCGPFIHAPCEHGLLAVIKFLDEEWSALNEPMSTAEGKSLLMGQREKK